MSEEHIHLKLNLKGINNNINNNYNIQIFSPVKERQEEYSSQSNEGEKKFSRQSGIKDEEIFVNNNSKLKDKSPKDNIISKNLFNLDKENGKNKTLIIRPKNLLNQFKIKITKKKLSVNQKNSFNKIKKNPLVKTPSFTKLQSSTSLKAISSFKNKFNLNKTENELNNKKKTKTIKRTSQPLNVIPAYMKDNFKVIKSPLLINKRTIKERNDFNINNNSFLQTVESIETNQKLINNLVKTYHKSGTFDNSRTSDEFRFSFLIKKNKFQSIGNLFKDSKSYINKKRISIQKFINESNIENTLLKKVKIFSFIQSICSLISILLCIIDIELYNNYSYNYILENNIEYDKLYEIRKREINSKENIVRTMNGIFSFLCLLMTFCIFISKYNFNKKQMKKILNNKNRNLSFIHQFKYKKNNEMKINEKNNFSKMLLRAIINIIFYPPKLNKIYHTYSNNILCIYPLNSFFLLLSSFKLYNIYRCIFYFIPVTANLGKVICQKYNVKLDIKFMFKIFLSRHKLSFPFVIILIIILLNTILLRSIEKFSVDLSLSQAKDSNILYYKNLLHNNFNIYDTLWIYLTFITRNILGDIKPKTPFGKVLIFIIYLFGCLFLCIIYFTVNCLIQLDRTSFEAYSKLKKLFLPENKENKASEVIVSLLILKKYYSLYKINKKEIIKTNIYNDNNDNKRGKSILDLNINKLKEENDDDMIFKQKKILFLNIKFIFFLKFFTDINTYLDSYKISRKQPLNIISLFQNIENKIEDNLESLNFKLSDIQSINTIFDNLKSNDNVLLRKLKKLRKLDGSLISYLAEQNNYLCNSHFIKVKNHKTEIILNKVSLKKNSKLLKTFKSSMSLKDNI